MPSRLGVVSLTLMLAVPVSSRQQPAAPYQAIVATFQQAPGIAIDRMLALPAQAVDEGITQALRPEASGGWPVHDLLTAAMLHTEPAVYFIDHQDRRGVDQLSRAQRLVDGVLARSEAYRWFEREWYAEIAQRLRHRPARRLIIDWAMTPRSYPVWDSYLAAVGLEGQAGDTLDFSAGVNVVPLLGGAQIQLTKVLERDPLFLDAALHLGRVEMLLGHDDRAAQSFARASGSTRPSTICLARLFAGALHERTGRFAEAEADYRRALAAFPASQSAPLSLAQLLYRTDRHVEAGEEIDRMLNRAAANELAEPWSIYMFPGHVGLAFLRAEIAQ